MVGSSYVGGDLRNPQLNATNHDFWVVKIETILIAYDLWDVVEVILHQPHQNPEADEEYTPEETHAASRENIIKNVKALSLIQGALSDDLFPRMKKLQNEH